MDDDKTEGEDLTETETARPDSPILPKRVGPYRILERLGEGGMGVVYLAEQTEPVRRKVALKVIKQGMDTRQVVARFESERQALAMMDHPYISRVFDAGTTEQGRPYFAMEYVKGEPITKYCDRHRLSTAARLELFMDVCEGVQHAHQKGIIHRDIKPSNVLVRVQDDKPVPKIIDFGVAKATEHRLTEESVFTQIGVLIGTPEYMSPEQAEMTRLDVDTRTDVYSLGVLLYELLVGALPFDPQELRQAGFDEIRRKIREDEPSKPSTRISTLGDASTDSASKRRTDPTSLSKRLRGDLDWITMKALDKDRTRRYGSPTELAADLQRHLKDEPVVASPPNTTYRMGKFVRRHRAGVLAAGLALIALLVGLGSATYGMLRAVRAEAVATRKSATAEEISGFLVGLFEVSDPSEARGNSITAREILDRGAERIGGEMADEPELQAGLLGTIGEVYKNLGLLTEATPLLEGALETRRGLLGSDHPDTLAAMHNLAHLDYFLGRHEEAESLWSEALEGRRRVLGREHPETLDSLHWLANGLANLARYEESEALHLQSLEAHRRVLGDEHPATVESINDLGVLRYFQGRYSEAEPLFAEALELSRHVLGDDHPKTLMNMGNLATVRHDLGRHGAAETLHLEALETSRRVNGEEHPTTLNIMNNLGNLYLDQGRLDESLRLKRETLETRRRVLGDLHPNTLGSLGNVAVVYGRRGSHDKAEVLYREELAGKREVLGNDHPQTLQAASNLAWSTFKIGRYQEAEALYLETVEAQQRVLGGEHPHTLRTMKGLADLYTNRGRYAEAEPLYLETLETWKRVLGDDHPDTLNSMNGLAWFLLTREPAESRDPRTALKFALEVAEKTGYENPGYLDTLSLAYHLTGDTAQAIENQKKAISLLPEGDSPLRVSLEATLANFETALEADSN